MNEMIDTAVVDFHELVTLALSIREDGMPWHDAFALACQELPSIQADIQADVRFRPSRVVVFEMFSARELMDWTNRE